MMRSLVLPLIAITLTGCLFPQEEVSRCEDSFELCPEGYSRVSACEDGAQCVTQTACGATQVCQRDQQTQCGAVPVCNSDEIEVGRCGPDTPCAGGCSAAEGCREVSMCGEIVFCQQPVCVGDPACPDGYAHSPQGCPNDGSDCVEVPSCDGAFYCVGPPPECDAPPSCPPTHKLVERCGDAGTGSCVQIEHCGEQYICEEVAAQCEAEPVCPRGSQQVQTCDDGAYCFPESMCGQTILCQLGCQPNSFPTCPAGGQLVMGCFEGDDSCQQVTRCGVTLACLYKEGCAPQRARAFGDCRRTVGVTWTGESCVTLNGCECVGEDCGALYPSEEACKVEHQQCS